MERGQGWDHSGYDSREDGAADHGHADWSGHDPRGHGLSEPADRHADEAEHHAPWRATPAAPRLRIVHRSELPAPGAEAPVRDADDSKPANDAEGDAPGLEPVPSGSNRSGREGPAQALESRAIPLRSDDSLRSGNALALAPDAAALLEADAAVLPSTAAAETAPSRRARLSARLAEHRGRAADWWRAAPDNLRGSVYFLASFFAFALMTVSVKAMGTRVPLVEVILLRQIIMTGLLVPAFAGNWKSTLSTRRLDLQLLRGILSVFGMFAGLSAVQHIPLAEATAIGFSQVLFVTVLAVVILKETVGWRRWTATLVGFVGVLVMLKPTGDGFGFYAMLSLAGAAAGSLITITVRKLSSTERTETILFYQAAVFLAVLAIPTVVLWETPTAIEWGFIFLIGLGGTGGQFLITKAYQVGEAAALAPLDFSRLIISAALGYFLFSEVPRLTTVIGAAIVIGATLYTMQRNSVRKTSFPPDARSAP
jgi:drug/metabolite transporter (DMT)-like permease